MNKRLILLSMIVGSLATSAHAGSSPVEWTIPNWARSIVWVPSAGIDCAFYENTQTSITIIGCGFPTDDNISAWIAEEKYAASHLTAFCRIDGNSGKTLPGTMYGCGN